MGIDREALGRHGRLINGGRQMNQQAIYEALRALGAATVYEAQGAKGALDSGIKPIDPSVPPRRPGVDRRYAGPPTT